MQWGMVGFEKQELNRPQFTGEKKKNKKKITNKKKLFFIF
jgi:hypothetical protein